MKAIHILISLIVVCLFTSCREEVIHVDLETEEPRLVIDASIDWEKNTTGNLQTIKLSTTTGYYEEEFPVVSGAIISITNTSSGAKYDFLEKDNSGEYVCVDFTPVIGDEYLLNVIVNGETYSATETLVKVPDIEDNIVQNNKGGMGGDEIEITYYYQDDGIKDNYYLYCVTTRHVAFPQYSVENNENNCGSLTPVFYSHEDLVAGDNIDIKLYGISKRYYDYMNKLLLASGSDDRPFPTTPAAVYGNIVNQTDHKNYAYGYFRLSEVATKSYVIK